MTDAPLDRSGDGSDVDIDADGDIGEPFSIAEKQAMDPMTDAPLDRSDDGSDVDIDADRDIGEPFSIAEKQAMDPLPRMEPLEPGDKEAARWNSEADEIEAYARHVPGGPEADLARLRREMGWENDAEPVTSTNVSVDSQETDIGGEQAMSMDKSESMDEEVGNDSDIRPETQEGDLSADDIGSPASYSRHHPVPATALENLDTMVDEKKAKEIAALEYPHTPAKQLPEKNLQGVVFEGMTQRHLEDTRGADTLVVHPKGETLKDARPIEPDFGVKDAQGSLKEIVDAKGYMRKDTENPNASASSLTHMRNLERAAKYADTDQPSVEAVTFTAPAETANVKAVQQAVSDLGTEERPVRTEAVGTEADLKQRMTDLQTEPGKQFNVSDGVKAEIERIQALPVEERRAATGEFVLSLRDDKGDETVEGRNLRWSTRVERNGSGITFVDSDGTEQTIWYEEQNDTLHNRTSENEANIEKVEP